MKWNKKKTLQVVLSLIFTILLVALDQFTKMMAVAVLKDQPPVVLIDDVLELRYLENRGAAFGILQNQKIVFLIVTVIISLAIIYVLCKLPEREFRALNVVLVFVLSGAIGNLIDRLRLDYVVDFIYFKLIDFPVFNLADIYVSVCCVILVILVIFVYKDDDFKFLKKQK